MAPRGLAELCPNCGASLAIAPAPRYCPQCGQETPLEAGPWHDAARQALQRWRRSLVALVAHPGRLTQDHLAGRRQRHVPPLRLYLVASFIFFLVAKAGLSWSGAGGDTVRYIDLRGRPVDMAAGATETRAQLQACVEQPGRCSWLDRAGARLGLMSMQRAADPQAVAQRFWRMAPNAVFLLLPAFAGMLMLAYRARRMTYGTHLVASLHLHSAWFLVLAVLEPFASEIVVNGAVLIGGLYAVRALHVAYGGRWWATGLRFAAIAVCYCAAFALVIAGLGFATLMTG